MVILMHIPSSVHCVLHSGPIQSARWIVSEADCKVCYAALRAAALEKSATTTLSVAFNLICSLISGNSARTRNPDLPITASKPVHPHVVVLGMNGSARKTCLHCLTITSSSFQYYFQCSYIQYKALFAQFQLSININHQLVL